MSWFSRLRNVFRPDRLSDEIEREMAFHLAQRTDDLVAAGLPPDAARAEARRRFGNPGVQMENTRERDLFLWLDTLTADLRYALRGLRRAPGFALAAILSLTLGIGANTSVFTALNAVMLRPLPVPKANQLVYLASGREEIFSYPVYERLRDQVKSFAALAAVERGMARHELAVSDVGGVGGAEIARGPAVTGNFFPVLGVPALLGRTLGLSDDRAGAAPALVISHAFWQRRFAGDSAVVGKVVRLDGMRATIVGVMPAGFVGFDVGADADLWWPIQLAPMLAASDRTWAQRLTSTGVTWLVLFGRLRDDASPDQARAEAATVFRRSLEEVARSPTWTAFERQRILRQTLELHPGNAGYVAVRGMFKKPLVVVMAVVGMVLVIACANVAGLMLARAAARRREFAVRAALGGGRGRIVRQLLTESLLLSLAGGIAGFVVARWATTFLAGYLPRDEISLALEPDGRVLLFTGAVSLLTGVAFGVAPALRLSRLDIASAISSQDNPTAAGSCRRLQPILVAAQLAVSVLLLAIAGLFGRTLHNLQSIELGFERDNLITLSLDLDRRRPTPRELNDLEHRLLGALEAVPGVRSATISGAGMLSGNGYSFEFHVDGYVPAPGEEMRAYAVLAGPRFFETLGVPLLRGREFNAGDEPPLAADGAPRTASVVILGEAMARKFFGQADAIGRQITRGLKEGVRLTVVGIAGDTKYRQDLRERTPLEVYLPYFGAGVRMPPTVYLRTEVPLSSLAADIRRLVAEIEPRATIRGLATMDEVLDRALARERLVAQIVGFFSAFAVLLASLGLYGVVAYGVAQRTREFGVRVVLGATVRDVLGLVLRQGFVLALIGCGIGLVGAVAVSRLIASLLYEVGPADPLTHAAVVLVLFGVALLACWFPARRAARVDPVVALRAE